MALRASPAVISISLVLAAVAVGCAKKKTDAPGDCLKDALLQGVGASGNAKSFLPDPIASSGNAHLSASSLHLDDFSRPVTLSHLGGRGVLEGDYAYVVNGNACDGGFGAFDAKNNFIYPHADFRFQEGMTYYLADSYRTFLASTSYLQPTGAVKVIAHCGYQDNAFFSRFIGTHGEWVEAVCLGDSVATPGASYSDDGTVALHELQHATTTDTYSRDESVFLSPFNYDEGGSLNEALSDFMALMYTSPMLANTTLDPLLFSRWALQTFVPNHVGTRGAHRCPTYDPTYPNCTTFPNFSAKTNTISYKYPDGLGWPYANNFSGPEFAASAYKHYTSQEEIHNAGVLLEGALWDVYQGIRGTGEATDERSRFLATQLVMEGMRQLPKPTLAAQAPVTFRAFGTALQTAEALLTLTANEKAAVDTALADRGLVGGSLLGTNWAAAGAGDFGTGIRVMDDPAVLFNWLGDASLIPQGVSTGLNRKLDPGELAVLWFDLADTQATTAGAVELTIKSLNPELVTFKDASYNVGWMSSTQTQIQYAKINGTAIVSALSDGAAGSAQATYNVPTGNSYFKTDPFFDRSYRTGVWVHVNKTAPRGSTLAFEVSALPSNSAGSPSVATFTTQIAP